MKIWASLVCLFLLLNYSHADSEMYEFPRYNGSTSTLAGALFGYKKPERARDLELEALTGYDLKLRFYPSPVPSKTLTFVLSGIGGVSTDSLPNLLADEISKTGQHVAILPSVFTGEFAKSFSKHQHIGYLPQDVEDLMQAIVWLKSQVSLDENVKFDKINLVGFSLGALTAAHLCHLSDDPFFKNVIQFNKVVLINSPVDLLHGLRRIDTAADNSPPVGLYELANGLLPVASFLFQKPNTNNFNKIATRIERSFNHDEVWKLIADELRKSLAAAVLQSQDYRDAGLLPKVEKEFIPLKPGQKRVGLRFSKTPSRKRRKKAAESYNFEMYIRDILVPFMQQMKNDPSFDFEQISKESSLPAFGEKFKTQSNIFLIHNDDDFLLRDGDKEYLQSIFPGRNFWFPHGGHLGNLWFTKNLNLVKSLIAD